MKQRRRTIVTSRAPAARGPRIARSGGAGRLAIAPLVPAHLVAAFVLGAAVLFGAAGALAQVGPRGGPVRVNTSELGNASRPSIAVLADGGFVIVWQEKREDAWRVFGRRFGPDGQPVAGEFEVAEAKIPIVPLSDAPYPVVAAGIDESVLVVWTSDYTIYAQRFTADGVPLASARVIVEAPAWSSTLTAAQEGTFLLAWDKFTGPDPLPIRPHWSVLGSDGGVLSSVQVDENPDPFVSSFAPQLALAPDDSFLIVWLHDENDYKIQARLFRGGQPSGPEFTVGSYDGGGTGVGVCALDSGGYVVTWDAYPPNATYPWSSSVVYRRRYDGDGAPLTPPVPSLYDPPEDFIERYPGVACGPGGDFVLAWRDSLIKGGWFRGDSRIDSFYAELRDGREPALTFLIDGDVLVVAQNCRRGPSGNYRCDLLAQRFTSSPACPGDCNRDETVTIDELTAAVAISLGSSAGSTAQCEAADRNHNGRVTIDELVAAVNRALSGCQL